MKAMKAKNQKLSYIALDSLIRLYLANNDELNRYELVGFKATEKNANHTIKATLSFKDNKEQLKIITLDLKMLKSLLIDVVIEELWRPLGERGFNNVK